MSEADKLKRRGGDDKSMLKLLDKTFVWGKAKYVIRDFETGEVEVREIENLITNVGYTVMAMSMLGEVSGLEYYYAVGSGTTPPNANDVSIEGELGKVAATTVSRSNRNLVVSTFFGAGDCNGTWNKGGVYVKYGTDYYLLCEVAISPSITKTTSKTVTVEHIVSFGG